MHLVLPSAVRGIANVAVAVLAVYMLQISHFSRFVFCCSLVLLCCRYFLLCTGCSWPHVALIFLCCVGVAVLVPADAFVAFFFFFVSLVITLLSSAVSVTAIVDAVYVLHSLHTDISCTVDSEYLLCMLCN